MKHRIIMWAPLLPGMLLLAACAGAPKLDPQLARQPTPALLSSGKVPPPARGTPLVWGGVVQSVRNLRDHTRIEIIQYPLDVHHRPLLEMPSGGSFVAEMPGFLEPVELPSGRPVTVDGRYAGMIDYHSGRLRSRIPLLEGHRLDLWDRHAAADTKRPAVHWGIGIGTGGGSVGVGIGL